jgi:hypothetical protein
MAIEFERRCLVRELRGAFACPVGETIGVVASVSGPEAGEDFSQHARRGLRRRRLRDSGCR